MTQNIPQEVEEILRKLENAGWEASIVGGCVRDMIVGRNPKDWDITTNALPQDVQALFPDSFYENKFGTVGIKTVPFLSHGKLNREHDIVEVTTYRVESTYSDRRRPDRVDFAQTLGEDLSRRDFAMNAIALQKKGDEYITIDPYDGKEDIAHKIIRAVGQPYERFNEDALRMMRAVRFASEIGFDIEPQTLTAIKENASLLNHISHERMRDELSRIVMSDHAEKGMELLRTTGLLHYIIPELEEGIGCAQNLHHTYTVWEHNIKALATCPSKKLSVRLAALLHDVGKPRTKRGNGENATFYNHDHVGARMTRKILTRLTFPKKVVEHATLLVDQHLFYYNVDEVTEAAVRRVVKRVGKENIKDLIDLRIGDRLGSGVPKAKPYKLRHFEYMVEKVSHDPISVKMLKLNGDIMIAQMGFTPSPKIGAILDTLLAEAIEDPQKNNLEYLKKRAQQLNAQDLTVLRKNAKERIKQEKQREDQAIKKHYWVK